MTAESMDLEMDVLSADADAFVQRALGLQHPLVRCRRSSIHGFGVFAKEAIEPGTAVIEYVGERIAKSASVERCALSNPYIFSVNDDFDLDGSVEWNLARFINHSCAPNCEARLMDEQIWIITTSPIAAAEEITFNYGYDLEDYRDYPCRCGSDRCVGYIVAEEYFDDLRAKNRAL